jgi:hypothetical protein
VSDDALDRSVQVLTVRGARDIPHSGRTLLDHLVGTYRVLSAWGQREAVCLAGLFHSCYGTEAFAPALFGADEREDVRDVIGAAAEQIAHVFGTADRRSILRNFMHDAGDPACSGPAVAVVEMANHVEQASCDTPGDVAGLAYVSRLGTRLRGRWPDIPPVFDDCRVELSESAERRGQERYLAARLAWATAPAAARGLFQDALRDNPWVAEPRIGLALAALRDGDYVTSGGEAARAAACLARWGTAWDKSRPLESWQDLLRHIARTTVSVTISAGAP